MSHNLVLNKSISFLLHKLTSGIHFHALRFGCWGVICSLHLANAGRLISIFFFGRAYQILQETIGKVSWPSITSSVLIPNCGWKLCETQFLLEDTLLETSIFAPENWWLKDDIPFGMAYFLGVNSLLVLGRVHSSKLTQLAESIPIETGDMQSQSLLVIVYHENENSRVLWTSQLLTIFHGCKSSYGSSTCAMKKGPLVV